MVIVCPALSFTRWARWTSFCFWGVNMYDCNRVETVCRSDDVGTRMGSDKQALCKDSTLLDRVAEKRNVILFGNVFRILSTIGPKSRSSSLSASSKTRYFRSRSENPLVFSRWSSKRPGVATRICGFFPSPIAYITISTPPINNTHLTAIILPKASTT
jgi:hypothetical protein